MEETLPLNHCQVLKKPLIINRTQITLHLIALTLLIYYRSSSLLQSQNPTLPLTLVFISELLLSLYWLLGAPFYWRPVSRTVFPERLPEDKDLPAVEVFICTADPNKEPTVEVMNTVISAMALDYPADKLCVYFSDDGGSCVTLNAIKEAWRFSKCWLPFCRRFGLKSRCPEAYFGGAEEYEDDEVVKSGHEFIDEKRRVEQEYEEFLECVMRIRGNETISVNGDHSAVVEVIVGNSIDAADTYQVEMPLLVYVAREKRPSLPHNFKAGALNALLRVSGIISNSPYVLVLDCDMYCNDASSARQAMCFNLDPKLSSSLAFVQFPQKFYNVSKNDIYDSRMRSTFSTLWPGMDGLNGPILSGTCFYMKREALYGTSIKQDFDLAKLKNSFGVSNELINSLRPNYKANITNSQDFSPALLQESQLLASCAYENHTKWGKQAIVEDYFTGFNLHCEGWTSVYFNPPKAAFLGTGTTSLNDLLVQGTRWVAGCAEVCLSSFNPVIYGLLRMSVFQSMCYGLAAYYPFICIPMWCLATIPQLCLLNGIVLYPEVSSSFFMVFSFIFLSSQFKHVEEVLSTGGSMKTWENEQRMWMMRTVSQFYGSVDAIMETIGMRDSSFLPTNKVVDDKQVKRYQADIYDFQVPTMILAPLCTLLIINTASFTVGVTKIVLEGSLNEMFVQVFMSFFVVATNYPMVEGMVLRKDNARIPASVTLLSAVSALTFIYLGSFLL
ncbi:hypothetical protein LguiA_001231 [Lonicera macranthoides]